MKIAIFAAGTGGHIYPALSIAKKFGEENVIFFASNRDIEKKIFSKTNYQVINLNISGFRGKSLFEKILWPLTFLMAALRVLFEMIKFRPKHSLLMGGYISIIGIFASSILFRKIFIHEQNSVLGTANKIGAFFATKIFTSYELNISRELHLGHPVRQGFNNLNYSKVLDKDHILVLGGSQGAHFFNNIISNLIEKSNLSLKTYFQIGLDSQKESSKNVEYVKFIENIEEKMSKAKFIICRSGASTVAEVQTMGLPAIFIPLPSSIDGHQLRNAELACAEGGGVIVNENNFNEQDFLRLVKDFDQKNLIDMSKKMHKHIHLLSAEKIANEIKQH